jgi:hypothetical protein
MFTVGNEQLGIRITKGEYDRHGSWHPRWPVILILFRNKRIYL